jgi:O-methyltransferase
MKSLIKTVIRSAFRRVGYALVPLPANPVSGPEKSLEADYRRVVADLHVCRAMREVHRHDVMEIEELYRRFVFSDLPQNEGRSEILHELIGTTIGEAIYIVESLHKALQISGDVCEFGVAQGATSCLLASEIAATDRELWLFDSFEGLPEPGPEDKLIDDIFNLGSISKYKGTMASPETEVLNKLQSIKFPGVRTKLKKGWLKDTLRSIDLPHRVAFAYVDLDFYEPIKDALEFLDGRMLPGAKVVVDDYGFFSEGAQLAVDQFVAATKGRFKLELPLPFAGHFCVLHKIT